MVERGDNVNMFCRKAKITSAHELHKRREIEQTNDLALHALEPDDPYFLASFPSVTLFKSLSTNISRSGSSEHGSFWPTKRIFEND